MTSRRAVLGAVVASAATAVAGCLDDPGGGTPTSTAECSATPPPYPTDAATDPREYPSRPGELSRGTVESFLHEYAEAYQYNDALAASPDKIGRLNTIDARVRDVTVETDGGRFTAAVSGQFTSDLVQDPGGPGTPETPTETPLPMGHGPFEATYEVTRRRLKRESIVLECW